MDLQVRSAGSALSIAVVSLTKLLSLVGGSGVVVPDDLGVFLDLFGEGFSDDGGRGGCSFSGFLFFLLLVGLLFLVGALHFLLGGRLEGFLVVGDVEGLEGVGH